MIYRHYKGSLYFSIGFATRLSKEFPANNIEQIAIAKHTEKEVEIAVLSVNDRQTGSLYYAYDTDKIDGVHMLYKDLNNNYWLRPFEMFHGMLDDGRPRFVKVKGEELFDRISELMKK